MGVEIINGHRDGPRIPFSRAHGVHVHSSTTLLTSKRLLKVPEIHGQMILFLLLVD